MPRRPAAFHASSVFFTFDTIRDNGSHQTIRLITSNVNANDSNHAGGVGAGKLGRIKATLLYIPIGDSGGFVTI